MTPIDALAAYTLITIAILGSEITYTYANQGFGYGFSSNRSTPELSPFGQRLKRSLQNHVESAAYVVPALAGAALLGLEGSGVGVAALLIVVGRVLFPLLYPRASRSSVLRPLGLRQFPACIWRLWF
ncbi:MAG: MAPEG family protein [Boseongicola sp.]